MQVYDTTLRDGTQGENINFSVRDKLEIARFLDACGIHYIEGGWPGSNPRDALFFEQAACLRLKTAKLTAFGSTRRPNIDPSEDPNLRALLDSGTPAVAIFGKSWALHVERIMDNTREENLAMIRDSVAFLRGRDREVVYDAEHFFDGFRDDPGYAVETLKAAHEGGADVLVLCDTNGGTLPHQITEIVQRVQQELGGGDAMPRLGIHTHNDSGMAVANAVAAVREGATMVHGTVNGYGERCGNADLTSIIPILQVKMGLAVVRDDQLQKLKRLSRFVSETANQVPVHNRPFVGKSAFAHKGGIHVSAIMKEPRAYEHMLPEAVGNTRRVLVSDLSGKSNVEYKARELGIPLDANGCNSREIVDRIKQLEEQGYQYDVAEGSLKILLQKITEQFEPTFDLESFRVTIEKDRNQPCTAHATVKISVDGTQEITAAEGDGPVSALDNALRKALDNFFPGLDAMRLVDFKVRVIDGSVGTAANVRVLIESRDRDDIWSTVGVSEDIIEASWQALADSFHYKLAKDRTGDTRETAPAEGADSCTEAPGGRTAEG